MTTLGLQSREISHHGAQEQNNEKGNYHNPLRNTAMFGHMKPTKGTDTMDPIHVRNFINLIKGKVVIHCCGSTGNSPIEDGKIKEWSQRPMDKF